MGAEKKFKNVEVIEFGKSGAQPEGGTKITLLGRQNPNKEKYDMYVTTPLSIELNVNSNNNPSVDRPDQPQDMIKFTAGSGKEKRVIATLDANGNLKIAGEIEAGCEF